jgi:serine/threonine protein phosphatase PrpC
VYGRVLGRLAISRAFGDFDCKNIEMNVSDENNQVPGSNPDGEKVFRNFIMSEPEIRVVDINPGSDDFLILASDGLFDRFSSEECVKIVRQNLSAMPVMEQDAQQVAQQLVDLAKSRRMMTDNITVILIALTAGIQP